MLFKKATFYIAIIGIGATAVMASRMSSTPPTEPPPIEPSPKPYEISVAAPGIIEALSENVSVGVAEVAFFPTIILTGAAGFASADLGTLVDWPSRFAQFGPSVSVPIFSGGRNTANLKAAEARYE